MTSSTAIQWIIYFNVLVGSVYLPSPWSKWPKCCHGQKLFQRSFAAKFCWKLSFAFCWKQNSFSKILLNLKVIQQNVGQAWFNGWRAKAIIYKKACAADETSRAYLKAKLPDGAEGYPCVHSRTNSLQTVRRYGTSQCGQDRDEFTY